MVNNIKHVEYVDQTCERCGSKRFISKTWKEKLSTYSGGVIEVECSQIKCKNKKCQEEFEQKQIDEAAKKEINRVKKEAHDATRKANALSMANRTRSKNKSSL